MKIISKISAYSTYIYVQSKNTSRAVSALIIPQVLAADPFEKSTTSHIGGIFEHGEKAVPTKFCFFEKENCI